MSTRAKSRISHSFQPADLTTNTNTIFEEGEPIDLADHQVGINRKLGHDDYQCQRAELIAKLRQRIDDLETDAETTVPLSELQRVQKEWQTSEDLLTGSQRDNEQKHETIEQYKLYVKDLEKIIDETLGPNWKVDHQVRPPLSQSTCFSASTPLPKPSLSVLRRSVSIMPSAKRSSKIATRHVSASNFGSFGMQGPLVLENNNVSEMDDTPTGAMRKLMAGSTRPLNPPKMSGAVHGTKSSSLQPPSDSPAKSVTPLPAVPFNQPLENQPTVPIPHLDAEQVKALLQMLTAPTGASKDTGVPSDTILLKTLERVEQAERAAEERVKRLRLMLEETKASCT